MKAPRPHQLCMPPLLVVEDPDLFQAPCRLASVDRGLPWAQTPTAAQVPAALPAAGNHSTSKWPNSPEADLQGKTTFGHVRCVVKL